MASQGMIAAPLGNKGSTQGHKVAATEQRATEDLSAPVGDLNQLSTDDSQTITSSSTHDPPSETMRANFPLPRELRDHIYSYLLDSKHTRIKRAHIGDRAYQFHTSILGVNRQMHDEAEEYLYEHNTFIVISHQFLGNDVLEFASQAPWVAQLHEVEFVHRVLDVELGFLSHDLDYYCRIASRILASRYKVEPKLLIRDDDSPDDRLEFRANTKLSPDHMAIEFRSHRYLKTSCELQAPLLVPLCTLLRPGLLVSICGDVLDHTLTHKIEVSTDSSLACVSALNWNWVEGFAGIKATADISALVGEFAVAAKLCGQIVEELRHFTLDSWTRRSETNLALYSLLVNTLLTKTNLHRQERNFTGFAQTVARLLHVVGAASHEDRGPVASTIFHQHMLAILVSPMEESLPAFPQVTIAECIERLSVKELIIDHQAHDVSMLRTYADPENFFTPEDLPVASCSFFAETSNIFCFGQPVSKPDRIVGYLDVIQLRALEKRTKEHINKLQRERGWGITRFEDFDEVDSPSGAA